MSLHPRLLLGAFLFCFVGCKDAPEAPAAMPPTPVTV